MPPRHPHQPLTPHSKTQTAKRKKNGNGESRCTVSCLGLVFSSKLMLLLQLAPSWRLSDTNASFLGRRIPQLRMLARVPVIGTKLHESRLRNWALNKKLSMRSSRVTLGKFIARRSFPQSYFIPLKPRFPYEICCVCMYVFV